MALMLFLDDEPDTLKMLEKAVQVLGHQAILARTYEQALQHIRTRLPDLIFVDMQLCNTDGLSVVRQLRQPGSQAETIPIIILSAGQLPDSLSQCRDAGAQEYLLKPVRLQTLLDTIEKYTVPAGTPCSP